SAGDPTARGAQGQTAVSPIHGGTAMNRTLLEYRKVESVAIVRLNRPEVLNALNPPLLEALIAAVDEARRDQDVRCVVVTGNGRAFSAGGDLKAMLAMTREEFREYILLFQRLSTGMRRLAKPCIAAINGYALAGGFELAIICDIRVAAD